VVQTKFSIKSATFFLDIAILISNLGMSISYSYYSERCTTIQKQDCIQKYMNDTKITNQQSGIAEGCDEVMVSVCHVSNSFEKIRRLVRCEMHKQFNTYNIPRLK
jgi:hypothetical protein